MMSAVCSPWPTDLCGADAAALLAFDHFAEAVGSVGVLALQMFADRVKFRRVDVLHDQRAIDGESFVRFC